jgi:hypothetical protein
MAKVKETSYSLKRPVTVRECGNVVMLTGVSIEAVGGNIYSMLR